MHLGREEARGAEARGGVALPLPRRSAGVSVKSQSSGQHAGIVETARDAPESA